MLLARSMMPALSAGDVNLYSPVDHARAFAAVPARLTGMSNLSAIAVSVSAVGLAIEALAVAAMAFWPLRRRLPNPFALQGLGFCIFLGGFLLHAACRFAE
jgi:hypothetical protein